MPDKLFDPTIHLSAAPLEGYKFDHEALVLKLNEFKKVPSDEMKSFMEAHPEYKTISCAALAEFAGLSEATLKKLKAGQIADPRGSTFWILRNKFGIWPRDVLKCIPPNQCNINCANQARLQLKSVEERLADKEQRLVRADSIIDKLRIELKMLRRCNYLLTAALVAIAVALLVLYLVWEIRNPSQGVTGLLQQIVA